MKVRRHRELVAVSWKGGRRELFIFLPFIWRSSELGTYVFLTPAIELRWGGE